MPSKSSSACPACTRAPGCTFNREVRSGIFAINLRKREQNLESFDHSQLADASEGFSGAEIKQAVVAALYTAAAQ